MSLNGQQQRLFGDGKNRKNVEQTMFKYKIFVFNLSNWISSLFQSFFKNISFL